MIEDSVITIEPCFEQYMEILSPKVFESSAKNQKHIVNHVRIQNASGM